MVSQKSIVFPFLLCLLVLCRFPAACTPGNPSPLQPDHLTVEYMVNPMGVEAHRLRFGWNFTTTAPNQFQSAYEIIVGDDLKEIERGKGNFWNSGKYESAQSQQIEYRGEPPLPFTRYYWRVRVYNQSGQPSDWSAPAWFDFGMRDPSDWIGKWISDGSTQPAREEDYYKEDRMPLFRKVFPVYKKMVSARLYISGLGYYEAYCNGQKIGDHVLDPGFTTYAKQVLYSVYDITSIIKTGDNLLSVMSGNGWWNPLPLKLFGRWDLRDYQQHGRPCINAMIRITYSDKTTNTIPTDESWVTAPGPVVRNNVYIGEHYEARLEQPTWLQLNANTTGWKNAVPVEGPSGKLTVQMQPAIKITKVIKPVSVTEAGKDTFIVDMGQNFAGVVKLKVKGPSGTKISMRLGEGIFANGSINLMTAVMTQIKKGGIKGGPGAPETAWQEDSYTLKGAGIEEWHPHFTFHGFRYVEITGWPGKPTINDVEGLRMNADLPVNGTFSCSNDMFNKLHNVIQWTFLSNVFSVQSDCPAREKMGYGADMVVSANSFIYNYDMANFYSKAVRDFANEQRPKGGITEIAPFTGIADRGYGDLSGPMGWQLGFVFLQKQLYEFYGDKRIIETYYPNLQKQIEFLRSQAVNNLFYWDISDHEAIDPKPEAFSASAFYYHHAHLASEFAGLLGKKEDSVQYDRLANNIKRAIVSKYLVPGTGRFDNATESSQILALWYGMSPEKENSFNALMKELERHNWHLSTGIFSTKMFFDVMRENNQNDIAYRVANQRDFPGWGYMLANGATTLWESWDFPETGPSRNHPMFGSIEEWFYRSLLGINPGAPGFEKVIIKPQPAGDLTWAKGSYRSVRGMIASDWKKENGQFDLHVIIPANTKAEVWIPCKQGAPVTESNSLSSNVLVARYVNGYSVINTGSGEYHYKALYLP